MEFNNRTKLKKTGEQKDKKEKNPGLPYDLVEDILSRLPVKTLYRFSCVCKTWRGLISDDRFVSLHREHSIKNVNLIALSKLDNSVVLSRLSMQRYERSNLGMFSMESDSDGGLFRYVCPCSCDLICFTTVDRIYLCNPIKRQVHLLPSTSASSLFYSRVGFVYSSPTKEYKVVHLFLRRYSDGTISDGMECETFTFGDHCKPSSSSWKRSKEQCPHRVYSNSVSTNGRIYWLIRHYTPSYRLNTDDLFVSFDSKTENFKTISKPYTWPLKNYRNSVALMAVEGNLCVADVKGMVKKSVLDIWMLRNNCLWEQLYSINLKDIKSLLKMKIWRPKYISHGEILFVHSAADGEACESAKSYNIEKKTYRNLIPIDHVVGEYWESLFDLQ